jgi:hypothetical protein
VCQCVCAHPSDSATAIASSEKRKVTAVMHVPETPDP